mmetsp:Transcript_27022/g.42080  ORF Transcript_27022/g.42080 Transcript_27022/m.42080 type:complete len:93 (+) Transcript_27022:86-364(+)
MVNCDKCCPEPCAICCIVFSVWGILSLIVIGVCLGAQYTKIDNGEVTLEGDYESTATACYEAAGLYAVCLVLCVLRIAYLRWKKRNAVEYVR